MTDEIVDLFDDGIAAQHAKARRALVQRKLDVADSATHRSCCSASYLRSS